MNEMIFVNIDILFSFIQLPMDLNLLKVFAAIYEHNSISRASESLFLTQSAVSHSLKRLRDQYEDPLFIRDGRLMRPTQLAQQIGPRLLATLGELESLQTSRLHFDPASSEQQFVIGAREALESLLMARFIQNMSQTPNIKISSVAFQREHLIRDLERRHLDLVVDVPLATSSDIMQAPLVKDEFCVLARKQHAFIQKPSKEQYLKARHIAVSARPSGPEVVDYALQRHGLVRNTFIRCQHYHAASSIVADSDYLVTLPRGIAQQLVQENRSQIAPLPIPTAAIQLHMYWHKSSQDDPANQWLRAQALSVSKTT